ncbi:MAG: hypothetical protein ACI82Q_001121 [Nonlabens sp.]|jgi:hypothetical protein
MSKTMQNVRCQTKKDPDEYRQDPDRKHLLKFTSNQN